MVILDANILLYGYDAESPHHQVTRHWLEELLAGPEWVGIPWLSLWAFIRISTNPRLGKRAVAAHRLFEIAGELIALPKIMIVQPGPRHLEILEAIVKENQISGPLLTDAVLAAFAMEHGAMLASTDRGFARFKQLKWVNPLDLEA